MTNIITQSPLYTIYTLRASDDNTVMYVGATRERLTRRLKRHISNARVENYPVSQWIRELERMDNFPVIEVVYICHEYEWRKWEKFWIYHFRCQNPALLNLYCLK